jgi:IS1 family transposase
MQNLPAMDVQCDEIWDFIGMKEKTRQRRLYSEEFGDVYTFTAMERTSKLLLAYHVGRRTTADTANFAERLRHAIDGRCQISVDGFQPYETVIPAVFNGQVDLAQVIKSYGNPSGTAEVRYSPGQIVDIRRHCVCGYPDPALVCTSHIERHNLSIRMEVRRMTRLTNAFSKKRENHEYHLAIYFLYYNFCRVHSTIKTTPAIKAGIATEKWSVERLLDELAAN